VSGERETLHVLNHPARYHLSVAQTLERIRRIVAGGLKLDAIEVTETGTLYPVYETSEIPLVKVATDDAHGPIHFGRASVDVDAKHDRHAIMHASRADEFRLGCARDWEHASATVPIGRSRDAGDAFMFYAPTGGKVKIPGVTIERVLEEIESLNRRARTAEHDVTAVSFATYLLIA